MLCLKVFLLESRKQSTGELFDGFLMDIKKHLKLCEYTSTDKNRMLRDRVFGIADKNLQKLYFEMENHQSRARLLRWQGRSKQQINKQMM